MDTWQEDSLNALLEIHSEQALFDQIAKAAKSLGFEYCAYGIRMALPISRPKVAMINNYSAQWQQCYSERGYLRVDPTVQHALKSSLPVLWSDELFKSTGEMWEEARHHGLRFGWAQAPRDASGAVGLLSLARSTGPLTIKELNCNQAQMSWLAQYAHAAMSRLVTPKLVPEIQVDLTSREKEVLRWTAEGKTAFEIAQILSIAERTVNFHINNMIAKLGASNKTQAAVKAIALGMLS